jgi:hypothetical protein
MATKDNQRPVGYDPPALRVLGTAHSLTQGPVSGPQPDVTVFHSST